MNEHFSQEPDELPEENRASGSSRVKVLVLLLLVAAFGYIYFFTGLIRPQPEPPKPASIKSVEVKNPMPPRPVATGGDAAPAAVPAVQPAAKPSAEPVAQKPAQPVAAAKPAAQKTAQPVPAKPQQPVAPAAKPAVKQAPVKPEPAKAVTATKPVAQKVAAKPAVTVKPKVQSAAKSASPSKVEPKGEKKEAAVASGAYTLLIGEYVLEKSMADVKAKLKKAGLTPVVKKGEKKGEPMNRLFLASFDDHAQAKAELEKLRKLTPGAFILNENGKFLVYAGSYFSEGTAAKEQDRLYAGGFKLIMQKVSVQLSPYRLYAGSFSTKGAAEKEATRLKKYRIAAVVKAGNK